MTKTRGILRNDFVKFKEGQYEYCPSSIFQIRLKRALPQSGCVSSAIKDAGKGRRYLKVASAFPDTFTHLNIQQSLSSFDCISVLTGNCQKPFSATALFSVNLHYINDKRTHPEAYEKYFVSFSVTVRNIPAER